MHPPITHRHDQHCAHGPTDDAELLAVAHAVGVTRTPAEPAVAGARHRPGRWNSILRALGLVLAAAGASLTGFAVAFGLAVPATGAALLSLVVALVAAVVIGR